MLVKCNIGTLEYATISHSVTLVPRLEYSINLLDEIVEILEKKRNELSVPVHHSGKIYKNIGYPLIQRASHRPPPIYLSRRKNLSTHRQRRDRRVGTSRHSHKIIIENQYRAG